jgi:hypothetical protein
MPAALEEWLANDGALLSIWRMLLWGFAFYLLALGLAVLWVPRRARSFLGAFAANWRNNVLEALLRGLAGLSFVAAASTTRSAEASRIIGLFLVATAVLMALFPQVHARFAGPAIRFVFAILPLFGCLAIGLAILVGWFIN